MKKKRIEQKDVHNNRTEPFNCLQKVTLRELALKTEEVTDCGFCSKEYNCRNWRIDAVHTIL
jgi:hypothetical protein